jgi:hypothetical protein
MRGASRDSHRPLRRCFVSDDRISSEKHRDAFTNINQNALVEFRRGARRSAAAWI